MGILDMLLINNDLIAKGAKEVFGIRDFLIARDKNGDIVCTTYDLDGCEALIKEYLELNFIDVNSVKIDKVTLKGRAKHEEIVPYKLVLLDGVLVLYKDVVKKAKNIKIKGFTGKYPKFGINKYETME